MKAQVLVIEKSDAEDIAILTGGQVISEDLGIKLENVKLDDLGSCKKVKVDKDNSTIVNGGGKKSDIEADVLQSNNKLKKQHQTMIKRNFKRDWLNWLGVLL